jgi:hypothetical protein
VELKQFKYENLLYRIVTDKDLEIKLLAIALHFLSDTYDATALLVIGRVFRNMSVLRGISLEKIVRDILEVPEGTVANEQELMVADELWNTRFDSTEGACFVMTPKDVVRLKIDLTLVKPANILRGVYNNKFYTLYLFNSIPMVEHYVSKC